MEDSKYVITVDYLSNFFEIDYLSSTTTTMILTKLKVRLARYGIPLFLMTRSSHLLSSSNLSTSGELNTRLHLQDTVVLMAKRNQP